jgi:ferrous iron transport protein A
MTAMDLTELEPGVEAEIIEFECGCNMSDRLEAMGIHIGSQIKKVSKLRMGGPVILSVDRAQVAVGCGMAKKIKVRTC